MKSETKKEKPTGGHIPVLREEVLTALHPQPGLLYVDATVGGGGHAQAILIRLQEQEMQQSLPLPAVVGLDQDGKTLRWAEQALAPFGSQVTLLRGNFSNISTLLTGAGIQQITGGVLADIGVSSFQLDQGTRGFSFSKPGPLDMRMDPTQPLTAEIIVNTYPEAELIRIFSDYGEARFSKSIAREICQVRNTAPLTNTVALAELVSGVTHRILKGTAGKSKIHPATQVFQALRIEVNDELDSLSRFLEQLPGLLAPGARAVIISFHSLEDRIIKRFFQQQARGCMCPPRFPICQCGHQPTFKLLTSKPITASPEEVCQNPRSRSAKLRAAVRL